MKGSITDTKKRTRKSNRGHRRAFSAPNAGGDRTRVSAAEKNDFLPYDTQKRKTVKKQMKAVTYISSGLPVLVPVSEDDDVDFSVKINEEEIDLPKEESSKRGTRVAVKKIWEARWKATNFELLPEWLQDNEYLRTGHRPPLPSFGSCFKSIFSLHTETGNIWTHMYGCVAFIGAATWFLTRPSTLVQLEDKIVFGIYFIGAVACLGLSFAFHTVQCHSVEVGKLFSKLDYAGISMLIVGSFIPWIYYGFYCRLVPMIVYLTMISVLGIAAIIVSLWDKFAQPHYRPLRAVIFIAMGLSSVVPALDILITDGISYLVNEASLLWFILMGILYITGAVLYATRTPEKCFPGRFDLWLQSHQLFHMFVVAAALVHLYGVSKTAVKRLEQGSCAEQMLEQYGHENEPTSLHEFEFTEFEVMLRALVGRGSFRSAAVAAWKLSAVMVQETSVICTGYIQQNKFSLDQVRFAAHVHLTMKAVEQRIMLVLSLYDKVDPKKLTLDSDFTKDLGLDSLDFVEVIMAIEDEFQFEIPDGDSDNMKTPRDIYQYICDRKDIYE